ncbi:MAG TPA: phosphatase PAP2 family protein [Ramlibacter sp.]|nr:phosphatase PAP2 family protein [Ramlibacter sp.]
MKAVRWHWLLALACVLVFAFLATQLLLQGPVTHADQHVTLWLAARRHGTLSAAMLFITNVHETVLLLAATAAIAAWRAWRHDGASVRMLAVVPAGMLLNVGLKHAFARARPVLDEPLVHLTTYSFPSGHAVASTVFYGALCALVFIHSRRAAPRAAAAVGAAAMVLLVCASRVYLGAHYLSDVVAGMAVGVLCLLAFLRLRDRRSPDGAA